MERKWYNFETIFSNTAEKLHDFLQKANIKHEISMADNAYHFEIQLNNEEKKLVEEYLVA